MIANRFEDAVTVFTLAADECRNMGWKVFRRYQVIVVAFLRNLVVTANEILHP